MHKSLLSTLLMAAIVTLSALPATAQTNAPTTTTLQQFASDLYNFGIGEGLTNLSETTYLTYTPSAHEWGVGEVIARNLPIGNGGLFVAPGIGIDYYGHQAYEVNGQVSLGVNLTPLSGFTNILGTWAASLVMTPYTFAGLGTPFSGTGTDNGGIEAIAAVGDTFDLGHIKFLSADALVGGVYGTRSGIGKYSGVFYGTTFSLVWRF